MKCLTNDKDRHILTFRHCNSPIKWSDFTKIMCFRENVHVHHVVLVKEEQMDSNPIISRMSSK